jgi:hypothetical protein
VIARQDVGQQRAERRDVPGAIRELVEHPVFGLRGRQIEGAINLNSSVQR